MSNNPATLLRFWREFSDAEPDAVLGGIYAGKSGYHNTRYNHVHDINGGDPGDYSVQRAADKRGPADKAAALDITFDSARRGEYATIAKYSRRLMRAGKRRDPRCYDDDGQTAIVREFFGNTDDDNEVEGWSWFREYAVSSDSSHLWHIHLSFTRAYLDNWSKLEPILDVLLDRNGDDDMPLTNADVDKIWYQRTIGNRDHPNEPAREKLAKPAGILSNIEATQDVHHGELQAIRAENKELRGMVAGLVANVQSLTEKVDELCCRQEG